MGSYSSDPTNNKPNPKYSDDNDPEMQYLSKLSKAKRVANEYFLHGRAMRDLPN
jgi:hypothetical protein